VAGDDKIGDREDTSAAGVQLRRILRIGILERSLRVPPDVGEGDGPLGRARQSGDVLSRVPWSADQSDRLRDLSALGVAVGP
jgi:hypothetical protein